MVCRGTGLVEREIEDERRGEEGRREESGSIATSFQIEFMAYFSSRIRETFDCTDVL